MSKKTLTESDSHYDHLEQMSVLELLTNINREDQIVALAVQKAIPQIESLVLSLVPKMKEGGRLFYVGAGTSGRLGVVDASECPPTFGVDQGVVVGIIAGGDEAIRKGIEFAEDDRAQGWKDLESHHIRSIDSVIGIAASGRTPYVCGAIEEARKVGCVTGCITCNLESELARVSEFPVEVPVGPEFVTGSTRMKAGTAQKLVLNMISTAAMIQLGKVRGNKMVNMQLSNKKLVNRGIKMLVDELAISESEAAALLDRYGSVKDVLEAF